MAKTVRDNGKPAGKSKPSGGLIPAHFEAIHFIAFHYHWPLSEILELSMDDAQAYVRCITKELKSQRITKIEMHNALVKGKGLKLVDHDTDLELYSREPEKHVIDASKAMLERLKSRAKRGNS